MKRIGCGLLLLLAGCVAGTGSEKANAPASAEAVTKRSGLRYQDLKLGEGEVAQNGDVVLVHYTGWLKDGTQFDSSIGKEPYRFRIGQRGTIAGWSDGIPGMKVGGKRKLMIPPELGYGEEGNPPIPPNAELVFDVELVKILRR
jgi:FKBP-type peptidyl-prolyl cis-trans isomerase